jgi:hypothetical protein
MANETYIYGKRALATWQKRPIYMAKETQSHGKETYIYGKRDLYIYGKRDPVTWKRDLLHANMQDNWL